MPPAPSASDFRASPLVARLGQIFTTLQARLSAPRVKRTLNLIAQAIGFVVIAWIGYSIYQQRDLVWQSIHVRPIYIVAVAACFWAGYALAIASWHTLWRILGSPQPLAENFIAYTYMSIASRLPIPYVNFASLLYSYRKMGVDYGTIGLALLLKTILHIVASAILLIATLPYIYSEWAIATPLSLAIVIVATGVLGRLTQPILNITIRRHTQRQATEANGAVPTVSVRHVIALLATNVVVIGLGGATLYLGAQLVIDLPAQVAPVTMMAWGVAVILGNALSWLPTDFGLTQLAMLAFLRSYVPISIVGIVLVVWRILILFCELCIVGVALCVNLLNKGKHHL